MYFLTFGTSQIITIILNNGQKSIRLNPIQSKLGFCSLFPNHFDSFRSNSKNVSCLLCWKTVKNQSDSIRFNPRHQSKWIRTKFLIRINPSWHWSKLNFQFWIIRIIPTSDSFGLILIDNSVWINPSSDYTKRFSNCSRMLQNGSETDFGMVRNNFDSFGANFNLTLSPGVPLCKGTGSIIKESEEPNALRDEFYPLYRIRLTRGF